jgi:mono/diheme cytochrome c family protein
MLAGLLFVAAAPQAQQRTDLGRFEYESNCLTCHGEAGRGDGPYSVNLKLPVPDLTQLSQRNGGIYPAERVRRLIDGREDIKGHGGRQMPIWGLRYGQRAAEYYRGELHDAEAFTGQRVQALTDYLRTIQR